jgi:hypothetical protein
VIPEIDNDPYDALRFAVDLHMGANTGTGLSQAAVLQVRKHVLEDAEAFLSWLRAKKAGGEEEAAPPIAHRMEHAAFKKYRCSCGEEFPEPAEFYEHAYKP